MASLSSADEKQLAMSMHVDVTLIQSILYYRSSADALINAPLKINYECWVGVFNAQNEPYSNLYGIRQRNEDTSYEEIDIYNKQGSIREIMILSFTSSNTLLTFSVSVAVMK